MVDSLYYSSRKIPERCKNSFTKALLFDKANHERFELSHSLITKYGFLVVFDHANCFGHAFNNCLALNPIVVSFFIRNW